MGRAAQHCNEAGCLLEEFEQPLAFTLEAAIALLHRVSTAQHVHFVAQLVHLGNVDGVLQNIGGLTGRRVKRGVRRAPVPCVHPAIGARNVVADQRDLVRLARLEHVVERLP